MNDRRMGTIWHHFLHLTALPGRLFTHPLKKIFHRHYREKRFAKTLFVTDLVLSALVIILSITIASLLIFRPTPIKKLVTISADVAPTEIVSGAASTLIFHYENRSEETLEQPQLDFIFPPYFLLLQEDNTSIEISSKHYILEAIEPHATGTIKLRGVMFGDVGGNQTFTTTLSFVHGEKNKLVEKTTEHTFHPARSTLELSLQLPERLVMGQKAKGQIIYKNTGEFDLPEIRIVPEWPKDFTLFSSTPSLTNDRFVIRSLNAQEEGIIDFEGSLPSEGSIDFAFHPSFYFDEDYYKQTSLYQTVELLPSQLLVELKLTSETFTPGTKTEATLVYEHVGDLPITKTQIILSSDVNILSDKTTIDIGSLNPGDKKEIPISFSVLQRPTTNTANILITTSYELPDGIDQQILISKKGPQIKITTPIILETFARYSSPQGDQIGRGPLPPRVGEETKYWIFLTVQGTLSSLEQVEINADLGPGVSFAGKQSISIGNSLTYFEESNSIRWTIGSIEPTSNNGSVVSVAFEVALTPPTP